MSDLPLTRIHWHDIVGACRKTADALGSKDWIAATTEARAILYGLADVHDGKRRLPTAEETARQRLKVYCLGCERESLWTDGTDTEFWCPVCGRVTQVVLPVAIDPASGGGGETP